MLWCDMLWYDMKCYVMIWNVMLWYDIYDMIRLASNEIFSPSNKIHREVGWAKDLPAPLYKVYTKSHGPVQYLRYQHNTDYLVQ
jgi:hypothetical protein